MSADDDNRAPPSRRPSSPPSSLRAPPDIAAQAAEVCLDLAEVIFVGIDADERVILINREGCDVLGYSEAEIIGAPWFDMFVPARLRGEMKSLFHNLITGELELVAHFENPIVTKSGEERLIAWHNALLRDERGKVRASLSAGADVTESKQSESTLRSFYDSAPHMMGIVELHDDDVRIVSCNAATAAYYGRPLAEVVGRMSADLGSPATARAYVVAQFREALRRKEPSHFIYSRNHSRARSLQATIARLPTQTAGKPLFSFITEDVTEREEMQARLLTSDRMASLGTLAAGIAHEINNPLAYVLTNLDIIAAHVAAAAPRAASSDVDIKDALKQAREGVERVRHIVNGLRTFSRGDDDRREPIQIEEVIETSIKMSWNEIRHRAELERSFSATPPVLANEARLVQLFVNLLINAARAIPEGQTESNTIRVATSTDNCGRVVAIVSDTGTGILPENIDRVFDPFFTTRPVGEGTGLGLSICHGIVKALGGEISVESEIDRGTTFRVTLPAAPQEVVRPQSSTPPPTSARRGRILIVDDEPLLRMSLQMLLGGEHHVTTVGSAREVLSLIINDGARFDVLLCDLMMPEMTGMDLYDRLMNEAPTQAARMVFLTGGVFTMRAQAFLERVPNPFLEKPFDIHSLRELLQKLLGPVGPHAHEGA